MGIQRRISDSEKPGIETAPPAKQTTSASQDATTLLFEVDPAGFVRKTFYVAFAIEIALVILDATVNVGEWIPFGPMRRLMNIAREDSLSAWLASAQTLLVGLVVTAIFLASRARSDKPSVVRGWAVMAGFFIYLAVDDGSGLHERIGSSAELLKERLAPDEESSLGPSYAWQAVLGPFFVGMGLFMLRFVWMQFQSRKNRLIFFAALSCYGLAVGQDFIEGFNDGILYEMAAGSLETKTQTIRHFGKVIEEFLELFGTTLFLTAFLAHFFGMAGETRLRVRPDS